MLKNKKKVFQIEASQCKTSWRKGGGRCANNNLYTRQITQVHQRAWRYIHLRVDLDAEQQLHHTAAATDARIAGARIFEASLFILFRGMKIYDDIFNGRNLARIKSVKIHRPSCSRRAIHHQSQRLHRSSRHCESSVAGSQNNNNGDNRVCYRCHQPGHISKNCFFFKLMPQHTIGTSGTGPSTATNGSRCIRKRADTTARSRNRPERNRRGVGAASPDSTVRTTTKNIRPLCKQQLFMRKDNYIFFIDSLEDHVMMVRNNCKNMQTFQI
ncbi:unnamed protein product [Trichogramma brassicae]|uniref:CCHC-type domain-containing protein n=1 Tax=Trichogramma brassicae TaxID=86971 RepID=A0A6H5J1I1_9HYME|nr:unnamed protein product [Trichogramma brassicae]